MKHGLHQLASLFGLAFAGLGALMASGAALALDCNATVTESVTLTEDIVCRKVGDVGITVPLGASNLTIDLNGHTISGFKKENSTGILVDGAIGVTIVNGTVEFFERGIRIVNSDAIAVTDVVSRGNRKDGIFVQSSTNIELIGNELLDNLNGIVTRDGNNLDIVSNEGKGNSEVGFDVSGTLGGTLVSLTNNESAGDAKRAAFRTGGSVQAKFSANQAKGFKGFGFQFTDAPIVLDNGGNRAKGKPSKACFPDPCPLGLK
ncbi:MAG: NosD domain-containing protein [Gammaproteobacteria bacterium]|jgi:hypothetical protein